MPPSPRSTENSSVNQLLAALPPEELEMIVPHLEEMNLPVGQILFDPGDIIRHVYFPTTAVISIMNVLKDGQAVEVAAVGHEGMVGIRLFYDDDEAFARAICQASGGVLKIDAERFWMMVRTQPGMRHAVHHYAHAFLFEVFQSAACNKVHSIPQRFARWMLTKQDRARTNVFPLTYQLIADMLTTTRQSAEELVGHLTQEGLIDYRDDTVHIKTRAGLESIVCECYERVQLELDKIDVKRRMRET